MTIDIALATYQGAPFLKEQLASLAAQSYPSWRLFVRDDGSSDETPALLEQFALAWPGRVVLLPGGERLGVVANFSAVLEATSSPYVFLCDQDDVWKPDKLEKMVAHMVALEQCYGAATPLLLHSDMELVDAQGEPLHPSFWQLARLAPQRNVTLASLLSQNVVTGCATLCNRALLELALPIPAGVVMHDWWLALVAVAFGQLIAYSEKTTCYRQHSSNVIGARPLGWLAHLKRMIVRIGHIDGAKRRQATLLLERYEGRWSSQESSLIRAYLALPDKGYLARLWAIYHYRFVRTGWWRQMAFGLGWIE